MKKTILIVLFIQYSFLIFGQNVNISIVEDTLRLNKRNQIKFRVNISTYQEDQIDLFLKTDMFSDCLNSLCCQDGEVVTNVGFELRDSFDNVIYPDLITGDLWPKYKIKTKRISIKKNKPKVIKLKFNLSMYYNQDFSNPSNKYFTWISLNLQDAIKENLAVGDDQCISTEKVIVIKE